jgi:hypothetical protein
MPLKQVTNDPSARPCTDKLIVAEQRTQLSGLKRQDSHKRNLATIYRRYAKAICDIVSPRNQIARLWKCLRTKWSLHITYSTTCKERNNSLFFSTPVTGWYCVLHKTWFIGWCNKLLQTTLYVAIGDIKKAVFVTHRLSVSDSQF